MSPAGTSPLDGGLVDVVRDFLHVHLALRRAAKRFRDGELRFDEVRELVGDSEQSVLFRLKERCHSLFRETTGDSGVGREVIFDLAVGALFHEAMNLRENFYQQAVYGPKVRALRESSERDADALFGAFETILGAGAARLDETFEEVEALLYQTRGEFRALLRQHRENGLVTRYLIEHTDLLTAVFDQPSDAVLAEIHGSTGEAYARAARSYVESGFFAEGCATLDRALELPTSRPDLERLRAYAAGMAAFLDGRYAESVEQLGRWLDAGPVEGEGRFADLAHAAAARVGQLIDRDRDAPLAAAAAALAERLRPFSPRARSPESRLA